MLCPVFTSPASAPQQINSLFLSVTYVRACVCTDPHAHTHTLTHTSTHTHTRTNTYKVTHTYKHKHTNSCAHTRVRTHAPAAMTVSMTILFSPITALSLHRCYVLSLELFPSPGQTSRFPTMFSNSGSSSSFHRRHSFLQEAFLDI